MPTTLRNVTLKALSTTNWGVPSLFAKGEEGVWYDPSDIVLNWRKNFINHSENFADSEWAVTGAGFATKVSTTVAGPFGSNTACEIAYLAANGSLARYSVSNFITAGRTYTFSIWARRSSGTNQLRFATNTGVTLGTFTPNSTWTRYTTTFTFNGTWAHILLQDTNASGWSNVQYWGAQLELGNFETSYQKITDGFQDYFQVQSLPVMYQDSFGNTPVSNYEQPVGLILDKRKGAQLGAELVVNGDFSSSTGWSTTNVTIAGGEATITGDPSLSRSLTTVAGVTYRVTITVSNLSSGSSLWLRFTGGTASNSPSFGNGTHQFLLRSNGNISLLIERYSGTITTGIIDNISVKELSGNHALQTTSASRPVLSARYNLLTYTEQFDNAAWSKYNSTITANATAAPNGTMTADALIPNTNGSQHSFLIPNIAPAGTYTASISVKAFGYNTIQLYLFDGTFKGTATARLDLGTVVIAGSGSPNGTITSQGNGWYRVTLTATTTTSTEIGMYVGRDGNVSSFSGDGTSGVYVWGADLRVSSDGVGLPPYQRVGNVVAGSSTTAGTPDYDTAGFPPYLRFDGIDDSFSTASINFTSTDKMSVFCGYRRIVDTPNGILLETSQNSVTNAGAIAFVVPDSTSGTNRGSYNLRGASNITARIDSLTAAAPSTLLSSVSYDISQPTSETEILVRLNGTNATTTRAGAAESGTGNFGNYPLYIGRRNNTELPYNGRLYQLIIRGAASTTAEITATEAQVNQKTKAY